MRQIDELLRERPMFHCGETEVVGDLDPNDSLLSTVQAEVLKSQAPACYGIGPDVARFLESSVDASSQTLEIGAGLSTLIFALRGARHIAVTPNPKEIEAIKQYAVDKGIGLKQVEFVLEKSETYLPRCSAEALDLVLIDGKHAFPWPAVDWFYTADRLRKGGLLLLDDAKMRSVEILVDFMLCDPNWSLVQSFGSKTYVFQKESAQIREVAWHMQPYNFCERSEGTGRVSFLRRLIGSLKRLRRRLKI